MVTKRQYRGAEVFAAELSALLGAHGHEVIFAGLYPAPGNALTAAHALNIDLDGKKSALNFSLLKKLAALVREHQPDIIQANGSDTLKYAVLVKKWYFPNIPVLYRNISMVSSWASAGSIKNLLNRMLFRQVDFVTSVGQPSLDDLVKTYQYPVEKTMVIRRGIPEMAFDTTASRNMLSDKYGFHPADPLVMHIGQFSDEKNHPFILDAFREVLAHQPNARLILIGEGKNYSRIADTVSQSAGLRSHVFLAGHQSPVQEWLAGADIFILGSTIEGVPGVILEAGMQGVPTVAVQVGGVSEVVQDDVTGLLLHKHDPKAFAGAICRLIEDKPLRDKLGQSARAFVSAHYSLDACRRNFETLYARVLNRQA